MIFLTYQQKYYSLLVVTVFIFLINLNIYILFIFLCCNRITICVKNILIKPCTRFVQIINKLYNAVPFRSGAFYRPQFIVDMRSVAAR